MEIKIYVKQNETKEGKKFTSYSAKTKQGVWCDIVFKKECQKPEVASIVKVSRENIFKSNNSKDKRDTYVIMAVEGMTPITRELIEDDFFD